MRILLVEYEQPFDISVKKTLEQYGTAVDLIDGEAADRHITVFAYLYDVIILDSSLPKKDGAELCARLRKQNISTPILVMSAHHDTEDVVMSLDNGADDFVSKPFSMPELEARVRALMRRPTNPPRPQLRHEDIVLDLNTHMVFYKQHQIDVTAKEFNILEYFMRQPEQVLTRAQIIDHVWDFAFDSFSNLVDVHIKNIRKKFKRHANVEILKTVRGVGYKL